MRPNHSQGCGGVTLIEAVVFVFILGLVLGMGALYLKPLASPVRTSTDLTEAFLRQARATAMVSTSAVRVRPINNFQLVTETAPFCSSTTWTPLPDLEADLPGGVTLAETTWQVCFSSRGISADNIIIELQHRDVGRRRIEVLWGGATRMLP